MKIQQLAVEASSDFFRTIIAPFDFLHEERNSVVKNFELECKEIGTNRIILSATIQELPVSIVQLILTNADNNPLLANGRDIAHVHGLWVRKDYQRQGIAENVMKYCEAFARQRGIKILTLGVDDYNTGALALYRKLNYRKFAEEQGRVPPEKLFLIKKYLDR